MLQLQYMMKNIDNSNCGWSFIRETHLTFIDQYRKAVEEPAWLLPGGKPFRYTVLWGSFTCTKTMTLDIAALWNESLIVSTGGPCADPIKRESPGLKYYQQIGQSIRRQSS